MTDRLIDISDVSTEIPKVEEMKLSGESLANIKVLFDQIHAIPYAQFLQHWFHVGQRWADKIATESEKERLKALSEHPDFENCVANEDAEDPGGFLIEGMNSRFLTMWASIDNYFDNDGVANAFVKGALTPYVTYKTDGTPR